MTVSHSASPREGRGETGQASVELVAVLPALLLAMLLAAQVGVAGYALWSAAISARAGARAAAVGGDAESAARRALPEALRGPSHVSSADRVTVRVPVPVLVPGLSAFTVSAGSRLDPAVPRGG